MKRILVALSVVLSANAASASEEFLCSAWEGKENGTGKPFILTKEEFPGIDYIKSIKFQNPYGEPVIANYVGNFNQHYGMYLSDVDTSGYMTLYYFTDTGAAGKNDAFVHMGQIIGEAKAACYRN